MQFKCNETGKQVGNALKQEIHEKGILGTIFNLALGILFSGK